MELKKEEVKIRNQENMSVQGPRVLTKLVKERRSKGILLPFTVDVYRGRALVLTHFNSENNENNNKNDNGQSTEYKENDYVTQNENYYGNYDENNINENNNDDNKNEEKKFMNFPNVKNRTEWKSFLKINDVISIENVKFRILKKVLPTGEEVEKEFLKIENILRKKYEKINKNKGAKIAQKNIPGKEKNVSSKSAVSEKRGGDNKNENKNENKNKSDKIGVSIKVKDTDVTGKKKDGDKDNDKDEKEKDSDSDKDKDSDNSDYSSEEDDDDDDGGNVLYNKKYTHVEQTVSTVRHYNN